MTHYKHIFTILFMLLTSTLFSCSDNKEFISKVEGQLPEFSIKLPTQQIITDADFRTGATIVALYKDNSGVNDELNSLVSLYERLYGESLNKLIVFNEGCQEVQDWTSVSSPNLYSALKPESSHRVILFMNNELRFILVKGSYINKTQLLYGIHRLFHDFDSLQAAIEFNKPSEIVDISPFESLNRRRTILNDKSILVVISNPATFNENTNVMSIIETKALIEHLYDVVFILDGRYVDHDAEALKMNLGLLSDVTVANDDIHREILKLRDHNFHRLTNFLLVFDREGALIDSGYVFSDLEFFKHIM